MAVTRFEGKLFTDADVVFPSMKDYYYNSLEPILESYNLKNNEFKYMEEPIGGEGAVGFVTDNMDVFSIRCSKDAFDLSEEAQNTGATTADSFLFYPKHKSVSVGASVESQKYIDKLLGSGEIPQITNTELGRLEEYKKRLRLNLMCVSCPKQPRLSIELIENSRITHKEFRELDKIASDYVFMKYKSALNGNIPLYNRLEQYNATDKLSFYEKNQVWKIKNSKFSDAYGYYYVLNTVSSSSKAALELASEIRMKVVDLINSAEDIRIQIPSDMIAANSNRYPEYKPGDFSDISLLGTFINTILKANHDLLSDYFTENTYQYAGFNALGQDKFGKVVAVIYIKKNIAGTARWINLNKFILSEYLGRVKNLTENTYDYGGTDFYIRNAPECFKPDTYNMTIACYQDSLVKKGLLDMGQDKAREEIQKKVFAAAGFSLCKDCDDLYRWTVSIGDVSFFVPPTQIRVTNSTNTDRLPILRAKGTMAKNIEKAKTQISLDLYFNNEAGINGQPVEMDLWTNHFLGKGDLYKKSSEAFREDSTKKNEKDNGLRTYYMNGLRALLSEFRFCPFLPVINKYINEVLGISAVSLEQILIKTVPGFPRLLKAVLVMNEFDYQVYMPEVPRPYYNEENRLVNPFDQCINYDVLRYYYQRPLLYGNELAAKLAKGEKIESGGEGYDEYRESYTFNSTAFIKDTVFGKTKTNQRTALLPCRFTDPMISIYTADESYLKRMFELKRTLWQKRLAMGFGVDSYTPSEKETVLIKDCSLLFEAVSPVYEKYKSVRLGLDALFQSVLLKHKGTDNSIEAENLKVEYVDASGAGVYSSLFDAVIDKVTIPMFRELGSIVKHLKAEDGEPLVRNIYISVGESEKLFKTEDSFKEYLNSIQRKVTLDDLKTSIYIEVNIDADTDKKEIMKLALTGDTSEKYKDIGLVEGPILSSGLGLNVLKLNITDTTGSVNYLDNETTYYNKNFDEWVKIEPDLRFIEYCYQNEAAFLNANETMREMKQAMDYESVKSIRFNKILENTLVTDFEASLCNNFANISLLESKGYAAQYVGGSDTYISWHIRTKDEYVVDALKSLPDYEAHCMRNYHNVLPCFPVRIESEFTKMMGVFEVSIEDVVVETVPNYPGLYDITIRAVQTDRTLRNREALRAINDDGEFDQNPSSMAVGFIDNGGVKQGKIRSRIRIRTNEEIKKKMARAELYPDLELPRIDELTRLGFRFIRYKDKEREPLGMFVDPDFYIYYSHIIFSELLKKQLETKFNKPTSDSSPNNESRYQVSDLTGSRVEMDSVGRPVMETANSKFQSVIKATQKRIKNEYKALQNIKDQINLAKNLPVISIADKKLWSISDKMACAFKESYIINLDRLLEKTGYSANESEKARYKELDEYYGSTFKKAVEAADNIILSTEAGKGLKTIGISEYENIIVSDYDDIIEHTAESCIMKYGGCLSGLYIRSFENVEEKSIGSIAISGISSLLDSSSGQAASDFLKSIKIILKALKAVNTSSQEYSYLAKSDAWKGSLNDSYYVNGAFYGIRDSGEAVYDKKTRDGFNDFRLSGIFKVRRYKYSEILPYLSKKEREEIEELDDCLERYYVLDPYYRLKSCDEINEYLRKCRNNTGFAAEAEFRILLWWLCRLYQLGIFPSLSYDIERNNIKVEEKAAARAKKAIEEHLKIANENQSVLLDNTLLSKISGFIKDNEAALDSGKLFLAALLALQDKPLDNDNSLYVKAQARNYAWLENYIRNVTDENSSHKTSGGLRTELLHRRFLLALTGYGLINADFGFGNSNIVTPAAQFSSIYNTKLALAACENPEQYLFHSFYDMVRNDYRGRLLRAFPTYYCLFIDEGREIGLWKLYDNFYSMTGINEISIAKSRKMPADTCSITLSNNYNTFTVDDEDCYINYMGDFFGELFDSMFDQKKLAMNADRKRRHSTLYVNRAKLSPGIRIHVRMGYGSDARELAGVFNGVIAEVNPNSRAINVVAQGNGTELMNPIMLEIDADEISHLDKASLINPSGCGASPREILKALLKTKGGAVNKYIQGQYDKEQFFFKQGESHWDTDFTYGLGDYLSSLHNANLLGIKHFGEVDYNDIFPDGEICQNLYEVTEFPALDSFGLNTYRDDEGNKASEGPKLSFKAKGRTFWDAMHIVKSVAPDYICAAAPFEMRDTIFLGRPRYYYAYKYVAGEDGAYIEKRKPFQQFYTLYSNTDIISNDITASSKVMKTAAIGIYQKDRGLSESTEQVGPVFIDKDIYPENQKSFIFDTRLLLKPSDQIGPDGRTDAEDEGVRTHNIGLDLIGNTMVNSSNRIGKKIRDVGEYFFHWADNDTSVERKYSSRDKIAWAATANALKDNAKEMYQGGLLLLGLPGLKPFDRIYLSDEYNDISGQVEVRDIVQTLSMENGFTTYINVDAISVVDDRSEFYVQNFLAELAAFTAKTMIMIGAYHVSSKFILKIASYGAEYLKKIEEDVNAALKAVENLKSIIGSIPDYDDTLLAIKNLQKLGKNPGDKEALEVLKGIIEKGSILDVSPDDLKDAKKIEDESARLIKKLMDNKEIKAAFEAAKKAGLGLDDLADLDSAKKFLEKYGENILETAKNWKKDLAKGISDLRLCDFKELGDYLKKSFSSAGANSTRLMKEAKESFQKANSIRKEYGLTKTAVKGGQALVSLVKAPGAVMSLGVMLALEVGTMAVARSIEDFLLFNIKNSQALIIFPLKRFGMAYTAGLGGSMGLVYGSPTFNDLGPLETLYGKWLAPSEEDNGIVGFLKMMLLSEDVQNEAAKYRRDNTLYSYKTGNSIGSEIHIESTVFGVARTTGSKRFNTVLGMSNIKRLDLKGEEYQNLPDDKKAAYKKQYEDKLLLTTPKSLDEFTSPKLYNSFRNLLETPKLKQFMETVNGFLRFRHLEVQTGKNSSHISTVIRGIYHKDMGINKGIDVPYLKEVKNSREIFDLPYLTIEAADILHEIVARAYKVIIKRQEDDKAEEWTNFSSNHILVLSALRIGDIGDKESAAGTSFSILATGLLSRVINNVIDDIKKEHEGGYKVFNAVNLNTSQIRITVLPHDSIAEGK